MTFRPIGLTPKLILIALIVLWPAITVAVLLLESGHAEAAQMKTHRQVRADAEMLVRLIGRYRGTSTLPPTATSKGLAEALGGLVVRILGGEITEGPPWAGPPEPPVIDADSVETDVFNHFVHGDQPHFTTLALYANNEEGLLQPLAFASSISPDRRPDRANVEAYVLNTPVIRSPERGGEPHPQISMPFTVDDRRYVLHAEFAEPERPGTTRLDVQVGIFIGLISSAAITALLALFMRLALSRPLGALAFAMSNIRAAGPGGTLPVHSEDQLGRLIRTFNEMSLDLKRSSEKNRQLMRGMREFNKALEIRVRAATKDLEHKNSELVATESRLYTIQAEVSRLERTASMGQLSSTVAHELSTPLNVVLGHLELLEREPALPDSARNRVRILSTQVNRLVAILKEMLSAVRLPDPRPADFPIKALIEECIRFMLPATSARGIEVVRRGPDEDSLVYADRNQAQQVILNLVSNAIEATPEEGLIEITILPSEDRVTVRVRDTGRGIPAEHFERLFEPYFTTKAMGRGTGLGLSISREIMKRNHGTITASAHSERGAVFEIAFPVSRPAETDEQPLARDHARR